MLSHHIHIISDNLIMTEIFINNESRKKEFYMALETDLLLGFGSVSFKIKAIYY